MKMAEITEAKEVNDMTGIEIMKGIITGMKKDVKKQDQAAMSAFDPE
jgi:hypothetical protein